MAGVFSGKVAAQNDACPVFSAPSYEGSVGLIQDNVVVGMTSEQYTLQWYTVENVEPDTVWRIDLIGNDGVNILFAPKNETGFDYEPMYIFSNNGDDPTSSAFILNETGIYCFQALGVFEGVSYAIALNPLPVVNGELQGLDGLDAFGYNQASLWHLRNRDYARAEITGIQATNLDPDYGPYWNNLCFARSRLDNFTGGIEACTEAITVAGGEYPSALERRGRLYRYQGDYRRAVADFQSAVEYRWDDDGLWFELALTYMLDSDGRRSVHAINEAITRSDTPNLTYWLGIAHVVNEDYEEALAAFDENLAYRQSQDALLTYVYIWQAATLQASGDVDAAQTALTNAENAANQETGIRRDRTLWLVHLLQGETSTALESLDRVLEEGSSAWQRELELVYLIALKDILPDNGSFDSALDYLIEETTLQHN